MDQELLHKYIEGDVTTEEIIQVVDWLDADENNVQEFMALHKLYDITLLNKKASSYKQKKKTVVRIVRKITIQLVRIAAVLLILLGIRTLYKDVILTSEAPETPLIAEVTYQAVFVPAGQRVELTFPDSTRIWINSKSTLVYPTQFSKENRFVHLDGEAYFEVASDENSPFKVYTDWLDIEVTGTEFNVNAYKEREDVEVSLLEGIVELSELSFPRPYRMKADEHIQFKEGKLYSSSIKDYDYFLWREGLICFYNETVGSIMEKLEIYYDVKIDVKRNSLLSYRYSGKFRTKDGVEQVLKVLQLEHRFSYIKDNENNIITIR